MYDVVHHNVLCDSYIIDIQRTRSSLWTIQTIHLRQCIIYSHVRTRARTTAALQRVITYESARRRGRVHLPLNTEDSALLTMLDEGMI